MWTVEIRLKYNNPNTWHKFDTFEEESKADTCVILLSSNLNILEVRKVEWVRKNG